MKGIFRAWSEAPPPLRKRALLLLVRGFDVPPSKETEFQLLKYAGYTVKQAQLELRLE